MLMIPSEAGITATIHVHAARKPKTSPKMYWRYGWTPPVSD
jgi:hypothetical protein